jgi:hypothetical protein
LNKTLSLDDREKEIIENYFGINTLWTHDTWSNWWENIH